MAKEEKIGMRNSSGSERSILNLILRYLKASPGPLRAAELASFLRAKGITIEASEIEAHLEDALKPFVEHHGSGRWWIRTQLAFESEAPDQMDTSGPVGLDSNNRGSYHVSRVVQSSCSQAYEECSHGGTIVQKADEVVQRISALQRVLMDFEQQLRLAKQVLLTLSLARKPLSCKDIVETLTLSDLHVDSKTVQRCLDSILKAYVVKDVQQQ